MAIETAFGIAIPNADAARLRTVDDLYWYVREHVGPARLEAGDRVVQNELWTQLVNVIEHDTGVRRDRIVPGAALVADLGLD
ncbi:MAG TPA: hypothetical protein VJO33_06780 [Gemmatimonadaceae bacterium]|nr:hypothetical protein [Gemmatimonadaceae bacterium]